jgi:hypothetical protein
VRNVFYGLNCFLDDVLVVVHGAPSKFDNLRLG